jgi:hypothetical protein
MEGPNQPLVVHDGRLSFVEDTTGDALLDGRYFSGISFEEDPQTRVILAVVGYHFGKFHGAWRSWDVAGRPIEEEYYHGGAFHGPRRKWYPSGQLAESLHSERFINMRTKRWDENGGLIEEKYLLETEPRWAKLEAERKRGPRPIVDIDLATLTFFERPEGWGRNESDLPPPPPPPSLELCRALEARSLARR